MKTIRKFLNRTTKEVENQLLTRPSTSDPASHDVTIVMETQSSTPQRLAPLSLDRVLDGGLINRRTDGSDPDGILSSRLSMLRSLLQVQQVEEVTADWMQMKLTDTQSGDINSFRSTRGGASASSPELLVQPHLKMRDNRSLPSSPHLGGGRRLPCSLPCSPLLGGRHWKSSPTSPTPPSGLSRLWVEEALQRSKNIRPTQPCSPHMRPEVEEEVRSTWGETEEEEEEEEGETEEEEEEGETEEEEEEEEGETEEEWSDEGRQVNAVTIGGIRLSDTIIFRPMTSPRVCGREGEGEREGEEDEDEDEDEDVRCLDSRYCLLTPCVCFRCPSAPPYEDGDVQTVSCFSCEDQRHSEGQTPLSPRTDVQRTEGHREHRLPTEGAPPLGDSCRLYPSLSLWRTDGQSKLNGKQELNVFSSQQHHNIQSSFHGNNTDDHLIPLCEVVLGAPGELKVFDSTTCSKMTARSDDFCSFCSGKLDQNTRVCRNCGQVFCSRCLCLFSSLHVTHQFSQTSAS